MRLLKQKILFALSLPIDFFKQNEGFIYRPYRFLYYFLPDFRKGSIREAVGELGNSGEVDKIIRNHVPYFRLTSIGRERLLSFFPIALGQKKVWDRKWRIVIGAPRRIKAKLAQLSFKKLARGVYLTPVPISDQLKDYLLRENLLGTVTVIESRTLLAADDKQLAKKIWGLEKLGGKYNRFINQCKELLKKLKAEKRLEDQDKNQVVNLLNDYFSLLILDPGLPKKVLSIDWPADFAREIFLRVFQRLKEEKLLDVI